MANLVDVLRVDEENFTNINVARRFLLHLVPNLVQLAARTICKQVLGENDDAGHGRFEEAGFCHGGREIEMLSKKRKAVESRQSEGGWGRRGGTCLVRANEQHERALCFLHAAQRTDDFEPILEAGRVGLSGFEQDEENRIAREKESMRGVKDLLDSERNPSKALIKLPSVHRSRRS